MDPSKQSFARRPRLAAIVMCAVPIEIVEPSKWKRHFRLPGKDKERARQKTLELFPDAHSLLARKRDHGRAEAALIALYGIRTRLQFTPPADARETSRIALFGARQ